jgi:hypothetical protein
LIKNISPFFIPLPSQISTYSFSSCHLYFKSSSSSGSHEFNLLVGEHKENLNFFLPNFTADFGTQIELASHDNCGTICIENLSNDFVNITFGNEISKGLIPHLKSKHVPCGEKIEISFSFCFPIPELPFLCSFSCQIIAQSVIEPSVQALCFLRAFVRLSPLCAIIESSSFLLFDNSTCTLAPEGYTDSILLKHTFLNASFSPCSLSVSLSSGKENQVGIP